MKPYRSFGTAGEDHICKGSALDAAGSSVLPAGFFMDSKKDMTWNTMQGITILTLKDLAVINGKYM